MYTPQAAKTMIQCDFDGTITDKDVSFFLLDAFADGDWRQLLEEYKKGKISVGAFNRRAFAMVKADKQTLLEFVLKSHKVKIRPGIQELLDYCSGKDFRFVIVSNGLVFYIEAILANMGLNNVEVFSARSWFSPEGMQVKYIGPDGSHLEDSFKETYIKLFVKEGYRVVYAGNGVSDIYPARRAYHVFATGELLELCRETNLNCTPFDDLNDVVKGLELLQLG